jgi:ABC-type dipeptide/oligopeptide/nickel transport system ATPase subunit
MVLADRIVVLKSGRIMEIIDNQSKDRSLENKITSLLSP